MKKVLILEDLAGFYDNFKSAVENVQEFELADLGVCTSLSRAVEMIDFSQPDVVLMDHNLTENGEEGLEILKYLKYLTDKFPETVVISTTDLKAPNHGGSITLRKYKEMGHELMATSKDPVMVETALKSLVVFRYHNEKPLKIYFVHPAFSNWGEYLSAKGIEKINELNDSCMVVITVLSENYDRVHGGSGVWPDYHIHYLPPTWLVNQLYQNGNKAVLVEVSTFADNLPSLHPLEKYQTDLLKFDDFLNEWVK